MKNEYISSPYKETGVNSQARQPKRRKDDSRTHAPTITKDDARRASMNHRWVVGYTRGRMKKMCTRCKWPAYIVEFEPCRGAK